MPLQSKSRLESKQFTSDPSVRTVLEACLVNDSAHIKAATANAPGVNDKGPHVSKIQGALFILDDNVKIDDQELSSGTYGRSTALAVLAYKRTRGIVASYQSSADDIVGKHTMAQLDNEMLEKEGKLVPPAPRSVLLTVGSISWIQGSPSPISSATDATPSPIWIPATYLGLKGTSNPPPPFRVDFPSFRANKQFRSMTFCRFSIDIDEADRVSNFKVLDAFHDPGFTPPFQTGKFTGVVIDQFLKHGFNASVFDSTFAPGEASVNSLVNTQGRHKNTTITDVPDGELVLVNSLIKFRAGKRTDDIGVNEVKAEFHVPWVWCEMVVTFVGRNRFKVYGRGSIFPSHSWYFDSVQMGAVPETGDSRFPIVRGTRALIEESQLKLFPVLSAGAPSSGPQVGDTRSDGPVDSHPNTAPGGHEVTVTRFISN